MIVCDAVVLGGGIVGCSCAAWLAREGLKVTLVDQAGPATGATAAGMGHLVAMDDSVEQLALTARSLELWRCEASALGPAVEVRETGTIWVAELHDAMGEVERKQAVYAASGIASSVLNASELASAEPNLRASAGGLRVPSDQVIYPPAAARHFLRESGALLLKAEVVAVDAGGCATVKGEVRAPWVVNCAGAQAVRFADLPIEPRKGHLVITDRCPGFVRHQLVELGYLTSAHTFDSASVAFNVQPRSTGQILIGSSREFVGWDPAINPALQSKMLARALDFLPGLADLSVTRSWIGFRAATPDKLPIIGPMPGQPKHVVAAGHEGLGITTALATAELVAHHVCGTAVSLDPKPFLPGRFAEA